MTNYYNQVMVVTDVDRRFMIDASIGDITICSIVDCEMLGWEVRASWMQDGITLKLSLDTVLLESVTVNNIPEESVFKQKILDHDVEDSSFWYHGVKKPEYRENPMLNEKVIKNPLFIITHPLSAIYYNFS